MQMQLFTHTMKLLNQIEKFFIYDLQLMILTWTLIGYVYGIIAHNVHVLYGRANTKQQAML